MANPFKKLESKLRNLGKDIEDSAKKYSYLVVPESAPFNQDVQSIISNRGQIGAEVTAQTTGGPDSGAGPVLSLSNARQSSEARAAARQHLAPTTGAGPGAINLLERAPRRTRPTLRY
jgi:hypothetical protein